MIPDALYWLLAPPFIYSVAAQLMWRGALPLLLGTGVYSLDQAGQLKNNLPPVYHLPVLVQALLILLITDIVEYWSHRLFHTATLWKFHAIHHSAVRVDWLTSARFHPVDLLLRSTCITFLVYLLGFSPAAWLLLTWFNVVYSPLVHANVSWTYGPFRAVIAGPAFHRWHHTCADAGGMKNFAPTFPFIDVLFGTYYFPRDEQPHACGAPNDRVSDGNIIQQLVYPFRAGRWRAGVRAAAASPHSG
jgi:sterol desaturase/sphingolipid hydroxylase (fatty acid hydroxylase superfamily)